MSGRRCAKCRVRARHAVLYCGNGKGEKNDVMRVPSTAIILCCYVGTGRNACATVLHS
jgi:hypothetical protein